LQVEYRSNSWLLGLSSFNIADAKFLNFIKQILTLLELERFGLKAQGKSWEI
jgi:hypothetical protein